MNTDTTGEMRNPLRIALDALEAAGNRHAIKALVDATDRQVERHQIHGWARELGPTLPPLPSAEDRRILDQGFRRLGVRKGLAESAWKGWLAAVQKRRREGDRRRADVRAALSLPPFRGSTGKKGGGRAVQTAPETAPAE